MLISLYCFIFKVYMLELVYSNIPEIEEIDISYITILINPLTWKTIPTTCRQTNKRKRGLDINHDWITFLNSKRQKTEIVGVKGVSH